MDIDPKKLAAMTVKNGNKTRPPPKDYYRGRSFQHYHEPDIPKKWSAEDGIPRQNTVEALHRAVSALDKKEVGSLLLCGANVKSTFEGLTLAQRVEMARGKIAPGDSGRKEALEWILSRLNAHGAGIVVRSSTLSQTIAQDALNRRLHHAVAFLDLNDARNALQKGADVKSEVDHWTVGRLIADLKARLPQRSENLDSANDEQRYLESRRNRIDEMVALLNSYGANISVPPHLF